uniref:Thyroid hormone receptor associated protein 3b n=1 Tax=Nothobranchius korthausae TaxID=1143690 RepID=A0A1A8HL21_9TELE
MENSSVASASSEAGSTRSQEIEELERFIDSYVLEYQVQGILEDKADGDVDQDDGGKVPQWTDDIDKRDGSWTSSHGRGSSKPDEWEHSSNGSTGSRPSSGSRPGSGSRSGSRGRNNQFKGPAKNGNRDVSFDILGTDIWAANTMDSCGGAGWDVQPEKLDFSHFHRKHFRGMPKHLPHIDREGMNKNKFAEEDGIDMNSLEVFLPHLHSVFPPLPNESEIAHTKKLFRRRRNDRRKQQRPQGGGGGGGNYGYKSNWQGGGGGWHDRHHDQDYHSPRRGHSRSRTPRKRSASRSRSRYSDRSSSGRSRRSRRSSYSSRSRSRSSTPRKGSSRARPGSKDPKEKLRASPAEKGQPADGGSIEKASGGKWIDYDTSPKRANPELKQDAPALESKGSGGPLWKTIGSPPPAAKSPTRSEQTASFSGFGFFSKEDMKAGDGSGIPAAFKKFLAENKSKKLAAEKEKQQAAADPEKSSELFSSSAESKEDKTLPFFDPGEEEFLKSQGLKERVIDEEAKPTLTARDIFGKWGDEPSYPTSYPTVKEKSRRDEEEPEDDVEEELYRSRKHSSKKEEKSKKKKDKEKSMKTVSPLTSRDKEPPLFPGAFPPRDKSPAFHLLASREEFELQISSLDEMPSSSVSKDRAAPRDHSHSSKKDPEFRSIFQHIQSSQLRRSPSELFAQHIVSIVHYIKAHHFPSSDMTLSERFAVYQRKAAEAEMMKPRKSPEIHRRIDVSPSAFKRHPHLFEDVDECSYKDPSKKFKGDVMDLRLDIERRKRFAGKDYRREGGRSPEGSRGPSGDRSSDKSGKHHRKSKKSKKKRDRSPSSSSSSSSTLVSLQTQESGEAG